MAGCFGCIETRATRAGRLSGLAVFRVKFSDGRTIECSTAEDAVTRARDAARQHHDAARDALIARIDRALVEVRRERELRRKPRSR
jgi:hypothetical protein